MIQRTVSVEVSASDIAIGKPHNARLCPIAIALAHTTGLRWAVCFSLAKQVIDSRGAENKAIKLPAECNAFIEAFDNGITVSPFSFLVDLW